ncbi:MAG: hypothetical protein QM831_39700 [Kofleriaceae bacterium]
MKLVLLALVAGCLDAEPELATTDQALNGETWTTVDTSDIQSVGIAASPTTHTIMTVGLDNDTSKIKTRASRDGGKTFATIHTFQTYGLPTAIAVDEIGYWFVAATDDDGAVRIYRSTNDGASWSTVYSQAGDWYIRSLSTDGSNVFAAGIEDSADGQAHAVILRGTNRGSYWAPIFAVADANEVTATCSGLYNGAPAIFAVGERVPSSGVAAETVWVSLNAGGAWTQTPLVDSSPDPVQQPMRCATTQTGDLAIATRLDGQHEWDTKLWNVGQNRLLASDPITGNLLSPEAVTTTPSYVYFTGTLGTAWFTRRISLSDGTVATVDGFGPMGETFAASVFDSGHVYVVAAVGVGSIIRRRG